MNLKDLINRGVLSFRHFIKFNKINKVEEEEEYEILVRSKSRKEFNVIKWTDKVDGGGIQSIVEGDNISVDNTDPQNPIISSTGGGGTIYIELTKTQLDTAIANSELVPGTLYKITEVETWMKQGDTTKAIYLHAISANELEKKGTGEFYVPKFDKGVSGYGIWSGELWQKTSGTMGTEPEYDIDDVVIWGGKHWKNLTGDYGTFIDHYELDGTNWEEIPVNDTDYNVRTNIIEYDYTNDMIVYRKDGVGNEISTSYENWKYWENDWFDGNPLTDSNYNPIKVFHWGNEIDLNSFVGVGFNIVENGVFECVNQRGNIFNNTINNGYIFNNNINNGHISNNILNNGRIYNNTLENNGSINNNTINNGRIRLGLSNTINNKLIQNLTINTGDIGGASGIDLSSATLVYQTYERIVFKNSTGTTKIRYFDGSGNLVIADITD